VVNLRCKNSEVPMSHKGQKQTFDDVRRVSALPPESGHRNSAGCQSRGRWQWGAHQTWCLVQGASLYADSAISQLSPENHIYRLMPHDERRVEKIIDNT
jgi:hypothetical protein